MKLHVRKLTLVAGIAAAFAATSAFAGNVEHGYDPALAVSANGSLQMSAGNDSVSMFGTKNKANAGTNSLKNASGNIGVNTAAGNGNQQSNTTALSVTTGKTAGAYSNAAQLSLFNSTSYFDAANKAGVGTYNVLNNAAGNIGLNMAAGANNQQHNDLAIAADTASDAEYARADVDALQVGVNPGWDFGPVGLGGTTFADTKNHASIGSDVLNNAKGNIGVNVAAGANNQQMNQTAIAVSDDHLSEVALATVNVGQVLAGNANGTFCDTRNVAELGNDNLNGATGNIGVNIAAGANNQQFNGLAIAAATR